MAAKATPALISRCYFYVQNLQKTVKMMEIHASQLVTARADGRLMVPYYDMINHRNGKWYNAQHHRPPDGGFSLVTNQRVQQGEQLFCSYNTCTICGSRMDGWGTPDIFEFYGFVEPLPQRYILEEFRLKFGLDERGGSKDNAVMRRRSSKFGTASHGDDEDDGDEDVELEVKWYVPPSQKGLDFLRTELERLKQVGTKKDQLRNTVDQQKDEDERISSSEWNAIWSYHHALVLAFSTALEQAPPAREIRDYKRPAASLVREVPTAQNPFSSFHDHPPPAYPPCSSPAFRRRRTNCVLQQPMLWVDTRAANRIQNSCADHDTRPHFPPTRNLILVGISLFRPPI